ncbi:hypothetical protein DTO271D3_4596 [Paecilomyces variotii]|nr:hypothetical protein DTO271D3_4596 [Paecilomyces variotii]
MPARSSRSAGFAAESPSPSSKSSTAATDAMQRNAPKKGSKRGVEDATEVGSPLRRSKRSRTSLASDLPSPAPTASGNEIIPDEDIDKVNGATPTEDDTGTVQRGKKQRKTKTVAEVTEKAEVSTSVKSNKRARATRTKASYVDQDVDAEIDEEVKEEEEEEEQEIIVKKTVKRKRKTKEEKEAEAMPLAARTQGLRMFVGAHVSAAKGVQNAVTNSVHIGGNAFALFLKSQRKWDNPPLQDEHRDAFRQLCVEHKYDPAKFVLPHGSYLVNLAQENKAKAKQGYDSFLEDLQRCEDLGIKLYNFHPGSANQSTLSSALSRLAEALTNALSATKTVIPVLETMCGHGTTIGSNLSDFRDLIALIPEKYHDRIGICVDTCHSFAAGYDLVSPAGFQAFMKEFDDLIGLKYLRALHLNDSKAPRGSKRDLHANIGTGFLGLRAFHNVMNEKRFEGLPMILETPIDRPDPSYLPSGVTTAVPEASEEPTHDSCAEESEAEDTKSKKGKKSKRPVGARPPTIPDYNVWVREIKLLESLIGMDPESAEFKTLEAQLSEEGRAERERLQDQYDRKLEADEKKRKKELEKQNQRSLEDMFGSGNAKKGAGKAMKAAPKGKARGKKVKSGSESGSE